MYTIINNKTDSDIVPKVSVVVPMYNSENTIHRTITSLKNQTFTNFEVIMVDDLSTDNTINHTLKLIENDSRFIVLKLSAKGGASIARNVAINYSRGKYIAFLDADDTWDEEKIELQVTYMLKTRSTFTYTYYRQKQGRTNQLLGVRKSPSMINYKSQLLGNSIGCLTVMYDSEKIGKINIPRIDKRNDAALWLKILKNTDKGILIPEVLSTYYVEENSLSRSSTKRKMLKYHYIVYRKVVEFNPFKSLFFTVANIIKYRYEKMKYFDSVEDNYEIK